MYHSTCTTVLHIIKKLCNHASYIWLKIAITTLMKPN